MDDAIFCGEGVVAFEQFVHRIALGDGGGRRVFRFAHGRIARPGPAAGVGFRGGSCQSGDAFPPVFGSTRADRFRCGRMDIIDPFGPGFECPHALRPFQVCRRGGVAFDLQSLVLPVGRQQGFRARRVGGLWRRGRCGLWHRGRRWGCRGTPEGCDPVISELSRVAARVAALFQILGSVIPLSADPFGNVAL